VFAICSFGSWHPSAAALVRHGADARTVIAAVLGVPGWGPRDERPRRALIDGQVRPRSLDPRHEGGSRSFLNCV